MLSRLYRKARSLDDACLRAWGYPNDHSVRQELLEALEWERAFSPRNARPSIQELFNQVHNASVDLANRIRDAPGSREVANPAEIARLRERLMALMSVLETIRPRT